MEFSAIGILSKDRIHLVILCPFCAEIHLHGAGGPPGGVRYGPRVPHCSKLSTATSYTIVTAPTPEIYDRFREGIKRMAAKAGVSL